MSQLRLVLAILAILCGLGVLFVALKTNDVKVLAVGLILAAVAIIVDRSAP